MLSGSVEGYFPTDGLTLPWAGIFLESLKVEKEFILYIHLFRIFYLLLFQIEIALEGKSLDNY